MIFIEFPKVIIFPLIHSRSIVVYGERHRMWASLSLVLGERKVEQSLPPPPRGTGKGENLEHDGEPKMLFLIQKMSFITWNFIIGAFI